MKGYDYSEYWEYPLSWESISRYPKSLKTKVLAELKALNPDIKIKKYKYRLGKNNIYSLLNQYDIVADGSDNFSTRYLLNEACFLKKKILVSAAINKFEGQLTTFKPFLNKKSINSKHPCYRCIYPSHEKHLNTNCSDDGVFSILAGIVGSMQANEVVKEYLSIGKSLSLIHI